MIDLQGICPLCDGVLDETTSVREVVGIQVVTEYYICRKCGEEITAPEQLRRSTKLLRVAREVAEHRLAEALTHRGYYRVEPDGSICQLLDDGWPTALSSQPTMSLERCVNDVIDFVRMERAGCYVQVLGNGQARALLDEPTEEVRYDSDGDFDV